MKEIDFSNLNKSLNVSNNKINILKIESEEKDATLKSLKEEILFLKEIINEKDNAINSLIK